MNQLYDNLRLFIRGFIKEYIIIKFMTIFKNLKNFFFKN
jgi:hypothetical protein